MTSVAVLGGGVAGLTAAHELAERGFEVTVYEGRPDAFGGKARSIPVWGSGTGGRLDLPGEHGFRFFPGFYKHIPDTMARIPYGSKTVVDHLVPTTRILLAQADGRPELVGIAEQPSSFDDFAATAAFIRKAGSSLGISPPELGMFLERLLTLMSSCDERRYDQWEKTSWWKFVGAEQRSPAFQKFLADGMTRTLVAARARELSARTGGLILCQLLFDIVRADGRMSRVLDGPTSEVWIDPWTAHLRDLGADLRIDSKVTAIKCDGVRVTGVTVESTAGAEPVVADYYVSAIPKEQLEKLVSPELRAADPILGRLPQLVTRWMNGIMFYLDRDVPLEPGHAIFIDSEWSLTAISQKQFWPDIDLERRGDGRVEGILSVDISEWQRPGRVYGKVATECTPEEIRAEVWAQMVAHIDDGSLDEQNVLTWFLDPAIVFPNPTPATNLEPLLINTAGSWANRPEAATRIPNFFLASDFVRTFTDLATMEGANEAARRAVNGILDAIGSAAPRCTVWPLQEPRIFGAARAADRVLWKLGRPPVNVNTEGGLASAGPLSRGLAGLLRLFG
ncbi:amine oxidase [Mycolicibacterium flavescens]|uniref:hydroxysqualene dehydroxylase n=1 Tax=Mycobacterium TaxID=1763 RepID=UPI0007FD15C9|nr:MULTISPECIES: FAD-dependent oxidoreductase [Mycobacterium]OBF97003.1 polyprenyl synthetase [Mycobacterium sp. 852002-51152_SCH6134967]VEG42398.1 amine oxidase [Mycolicibacterium flavescens]